MFNEIKDVEISLTAFYFSYVDKLYNDPIYRKQILSYQRLQNFDNALSERELFEKILVVYLEEAELALSLIKDLNFKKEDLLLEVGGGNGFVYGFLKKLGFNIYGIEPSDSGSDDAGFSGFFNAARRLFKIIEVDDSHFYPLSAEECVKLDNQFDIIFSNNVLEHIPKLKESFLAMKNVLKPDGLMIHNTHNYFIPYEPHLKIALFPLFPRFTEFFRPNLKKSFLWNGLNFITTRKLKNLCKIVGLSIKFKKDVLQKTFFRLDTDRGFAERQKIFIPLYKILKLTRLIKILNKIPIVFTDPIVFTVKK